MIAILLFLVAAIVLGITYRDNQVLGMIVPVVITFGVISYSIYYFGYAFSKIRRPASDGRIITFNFEEKSISISTDTGAKGSLNYREIKKVVMIDELYFISYGSSDVFVLQASGFEDNGSSFETLLTAKKIHLTKK